MTTDIVGALDVLLAAMFIGASIYGLIAVIRSPRIDPEELERAKMRSCSWPTKDGDAFAATAPFQSKAEPTLVNDLVGRSLDDSGNSVDRKTNRTRPRAGIGFRILRS